MRYKKIIALLLVLSFAWLTGCSFLNNFTDKAMLSVASEYTRSVVNVDVDGITGRMLDGDDCKDELTAFVEGNNDNALYAEICNAIQRTLSSELDEGSAVLSSSDNTGSVKVTYTLVDYSFVLDSYMNNGCYRCDYVEGIVDHPQKITIEQQIDMVYEGGQWLVKDDDCKDLYEVYRFYTDTLSNWYSYEHVIDNIGIITEDHFVDNDGLVTEIDYLESALTRFYRLTGIRSTVYTIYSEDYQDNWSSLQEYTLDKYKELFGDDESRCLVVLAVPRAQRDRFVSGADKITEFAFEVVQGDDTDLLLTPEMDKKLVSTSYSILKNSGLPGFSFGAAFNTVFGLLNVGGSWSELAEGYVRLDH